MHGRPLGARRKPRGIPTAFMEALDSTVPEPKGRVCRKSTRMRAAPRLGASTSTTSSSSREGPAGLRAAGNGSFWPQLAEQGGEREGALGTRRLRGGRCRSKLASPLREGVMGAWCPTPMAGGDACEPMGLSRESRFPGRAVLRCVNHRRSRTSGGGLPEQPTCTAAQSWPPAWRLFSAMACQGTAELRQGRGQLRALGPVSVEEAVGVTLGGRLAERDGLLTRAAGRAHLESVCKACSGTDGNYELGRVCAQLVSDFLRASLRAYGWQQAGELTRRRSAGLTGA